MLQCIQIRRFLTEIKKENNKQNKKTKNRVIGYECVGEHNIKLKTRKALSTKLENKTKKLLRPECDIVILCRQRHYTFDGSYLGVRYKNYQLHKLSVSKIKELNR